MTNKILYADDEETLRKALGMLLEMKFPKLDIESFKDGSSLETRLNGSLEDVRLVLTDNDMPGIKGSEIIMAYAKRPEFKYIPFIIFYGGDESIGKELVEKYGAYAYVLKGTVPKGLIGKIQEALDR